VKKSDQTKSCLSEASLILLGFFYAHEALSSNNALELGGLLLYLILSFRLMGILLYTVRPMEIIRYSIALFELKRFASS